jgi:RND superfamily putative drug exporter
VWVVTALALGLLALGTTGLDANGLQDRDSFRTRPEAVAGEAALARGRDVAPTSWRGRSRRS